MIDHPQPAPARWIVAEASAPHPRRPPRWLTASRRLVPEAAAQPAGVAVIAAADATEVLSMTAGAARAAVLWEIDRERFEPACRSVARISVAAPGVLQIAAVGRLAPRDQLLLSEFGVAACITAPEELPRLAPLIRGAFAHSLQSLD